MFRRSCALGVFKARADCDVVHKDSKVRMKMIPNPVSSYTKLPASMKEALGLGNGERELAEKESRRQLVSQLLRSGDKASSAAAALVDKLRNQAAGRSADLLGPVELHVVDTTGAVRSAKTFVTFGTEKEESTVLGKAAQLGLADLEKLGVSYNYATHDVVFVDAKSQEAGAPGETPENHRHMTSDAKKVAGQMLPQQGAFNMPKPSAAPEGPLEYTRD